MKHDISLYPVLLDTLKMTKNDLATELGISPRSVYRWKDAPPAYAVAYLRLKLRVMETFLEVR